MSSQWGSKKLLQGFVSHKLTAYLCIFNLFKLNELGKYYQKKINQIILNCASLWSLALRIFEAFIRICWLWIFPSIKLSWHSSSVWNKPGSLNWFWQFLCEVIFLYSERILLLICMFSLFMWKKDFLLHRTYL